MGFFSDDKRKEKEEYGVLSYFDDKEDNDNDEELDNYGLEDWEKEEVKKGNEDIFNFEEEDLEDDDYYSDDDE